MFDNDAGGDRPLLFDDFDLAQVLDYPRAVLVPSAPGGLARLMRVVKAVRED
jgi:hypothetical protein